VVVVIHARDLGPVLDGEEVGLEVRGRLVACCFCCGVVCVLVLVVLVVVEWRVHVLPCVCWGGAPFRTRRTDPTHGPTLFERERARARGSPLNHLRTLCGEATQARLLLLGGGLTDGGHQEGCVEEVSCNNRVYVRVGQSVSRHRVLCSASNPSTRPS
jgi:hypothetical protein